MTASAEQVVVTGLGVVSPIGVGLSAFWSSLVEGKSGIRPLQLFDASSLPIRIGGEVLDFDAKNRVRPRKSIKVMSRDIQFAFAAADEACTHAALAGATDPERFGVVFGSDLIQPDPIEAIGGYKASMVDGEFDFERWGQGAMPEIYPLWMLKHLPNMPACHIGIRYDARGPNNTIAEGDVSSILAIGEAADVIRRGHADVMIVGGTGSRMNISDLMWHRGARIACNGKPLPAQICRPFDAERTGMVCGEGAAQIVLESREFAERRGATPLARIAGFASRTEPAAVAQQPTGSAIRRAIKAALELSEIASDEIGHVNAHGQSTIEDDPIEAKAIRQTLGDVPVTGLKSYFGNLGQGTGMVELAVSLLALEKGVIPPTLNYETPDPECPVNVVTEVEPSDKATFIKLSHNATGQAAAVVVSAF